MTSPPLADGDTLDPAEPADHDGQSGEPCLPDSVLGRLLQELSWEGSRIRAYRQGGIGYENVLTAEALTGLDFLPRSAFLGEVLRRAHGAPAAREVLIEEVEQAQFTLLPGDVILAPTRTKRGERLIVQPDGILVSPSCHALIEAKRIRSSSFQTEQLAREYVGVLREARSKTPLLLLVLGAPPPVKVKRHGKVSIDEAIALHLGSVLERAEDHQFEPDALRAGIPEVVAWTTWEQVGQVVTEQSRAFVSADASVAAAIQRLARSTTQAIARHS